MLNPDGVIFGNNRVSLSGVDLNRAWRRPSKAEHPTIWGWKSQIRDLKGTYDVCMFCDLHGHSRKMNTFMYGCDDKRKPKPTVRVFPKLLSWNQHGRKYVSFADCCFAVKKGREGTGRVVVSKELGIQNSYTMEATFCGADFGPLKDVHFNTSHLAESGRALIDTLLDYYMPNPMQREKAANLLKQAAERKAARDRSERMAAARHAMQQIRRSSGGGGGNGGNGNGGSGAGGGSIGGGEASKVQGGDSLEREVLGKVNSVGMRVGGGIGILSRSGSVGASAATSLLSQQPTRKGEGGNGNCGSISAMAKVNGFMIEGDKRGSRVRTPGIQGRMGGGGGGTVAGAVGANGGGAVGAGGGGGGGGGGIGMGSGDVGAFGGRMRPLVGFDRDNRERDNYSAKRGGVSVISNGFIKRQQQQGPPREDNRASISAGGGGGQTTSYFSRRHHHNNVVSGGLGDEVIVPNNVNSNVSNRLAVIPGAKRNPGSSSSGAPSQQQQQQQQQQQPQASVASSASTTSNWLLTTLSRDANAISRERVSAIAGAASARNGRGGGSHHHASSAAMEHGNRGCVREKDSSCAMKVNARGGQGVQGVGGFGVASSSSSSSCGLTPSSINSATTASSIYDTSTTTMMGASQRASPSPSYHNAGVERITASSTGGASGGQNCASPASRHRKIHATTNAVQPSSQRQQQQHANSSSSLHATGNDSGVGRVVNEVHSTTAGGSFGGGKGGHWWNARGTGVKSLPKVDM